MSALFGDCRGDHLWRGGGSCVLCHIQLRCHCGQFMTESGMEKHLNESCPLSLREVGYGMCEIKECQEEATHRVMSITGWGWYCKPHSFWVREVERNWSQAEAAYLEQDSV